MFGLAKKKKKNKEKKQEQQASVSKEAVELAQTDQIKRAQAVLSCLSNPENYKDPNIAFQLQNELKEIMKPIVKEKGSEIFREVDKVLGYGAYGVNDLFSIRPQGTSFFNVTDNPWEIFAYLAENYWAVQICRDEILKAVKGDGWYPVGDKKNFDVFRKRVKEMGLDEMYYQLCDHAKIYGNWWIWKKRSMLGSVDLEVLIPRFLRPIYSMDRSRIIGYYYQVGNTNLRLKPEEVIHGRWRPSHRARQLGSPPLGATLVDIEAALKGSMFNNMVMDKGGLYGIAVLMDSPKGNVPGNSQLELMKQMEREFRANQSGARAAYDTVFLAGARDIKQMSPLKEMDGAWRGTSDVAARQSSKIMGVPFEWVIDTTSHEQYHAASLEDMNILRFDTTINELEEVILGFMNTDIVQYMGIPGVFFKAKKRYNSRTKAGAELLLTYAKIDGFMSKDEGRQIVKLPALGGSEGKKALKPYPNVSASVDGAPAQVNVPIPIDEQDEIDSQT